MMARWSHRTLMHPDLWAQVAGVSPCAWNGVNAGDDIMNCELWYQKPWQAPNTRAGRETVGQALLQAEMKMSARLGFHVAPAYIREELHDWPRRTARLGLRWGYLRAVGVEARDTLEVGAAVAYSGITSARDTATVTVTVPAGTDPCEVAAYYPGEVSAGAIADADETWRLYPLSVAVDGTTATLTFWRCQMVKWSEHEAGLIVDIDDAAAFLETVDVYRRYTDPRGAFALWSDGCGGGCYSCVCDTADGAGCADVSQALCGVVLNRRLSHIEAAPATYDPDAGTWSAATWQYCIRPRNAQVSYLAGWREDTARGCEAWGDLKEVLAKLSLTMMRENVCQCDQLSWLWDSARRELDTLTRDVASAYSMFGSRMAGALDAYIWVKEHAITRGGKL